MPKKFKFLAERVFLKDGHRGSGNQVIKYTKYVIVLKELNIGLY